MKPIIIYNDKWLNFCGKNINGMAIFPFIILRKKSDVLSNHESIHIQQQIELLLIGFVILYYCNWIHNIIKLKFRKDCVRESYKNILFEKEAYTNENNLKYLDNRKLYNYFRSE